MTVTFHPAALAEATEAAKYYDAQRPGLGAEFENALRQGHGASVKLVAAFQGIPQIACIASPTALFIAFVTTTY